MKAKLGQNFLIDQNILSFEAKSADVSKKSVLEIGAGDGRLTERLLKEGAGHLVAVEFDPKLAKKLRMKFQHYDRVRVHEGDFLLFDESARFNVIVGNVPYYITSPILLKLSRMNFDRAVICIQSEVASRMVAEEGSHEYGRLSVTCRLLFNTEVLALVPRDAFSPRPKVDSCIISIAKTGVALSPEEEKMIGALFSHKKKCLKNAVVDARMEIFGSDDKGRASSVGHKLKYAERKVFSLAPSEALETAREIGSI